MNTQDIARYAMAQLEKTGAQQYSVAAHTAKKHEFNVDSGQFSLLRTTLDNSLDLTLILDHKRVKVLINDFSEEAVNQAVKDCLASAQSAEADEAWQLYNGGQHRFTQGAPEGDMERLFERSEEMLSSIRSEYPKVSLEQMIVSHERAEGLYLNNLGASFETLAGQYGAVIMFSGHEDGKTSSFNYCSVAADNLDTPFLDLSTLRMNLKDAENQIHTVAPEGKYVGSVVFTPDCLGNILWYLLDTYVGDSSMLDGISPWKDEQGQQVVDKRLTLGLNPLSDDVVCGERYMADGRLSADYDVIKDGVLKQFTLGSFVANKLKMPPAPNGSMNMMVAAGDTPLTDIIKGIDKGLLVSRFSGGEPASDGTFSGVAKNSFLIENGQVGQAVSETMISGNLGGMMKQLRGISKERVSDGGGILPWLAVDGITISGK